MRQTIHQRLKKLEDTIHPPQSHTFRYGWVIPLPRDYAGERHVMAENVQELVPGIEWCDFVENPGPRPLERAG